MTNPIIFKWMAVAMIVSATTMIVAVVMIVSAAVVTVLMVVVAIIVIVLVRFWTSHGFVDNYLYALMLVVFRHLKLLHKNLGEDLSQTIANQ
jgi:hypothetical protein